MQFSFHDQTIRVNIPDWAALETALKARLGTRQGFALATVNLDHLVKMRNSPEFAKVYAGHDYVVADGRPIVALSQLAHRPVQLLPGSDLVIPLCHMAAAAGAKVALVGSTEMALEDAREVLSAQVPGLDVQLCISPSVPFDPEGIEAAKILQRLEDEGIGLCLLALGAPRQEALALRGRALAPSVGFASIGAGLDFLGGHQHRAPRWMRRVGLEWLWRALSSPRRLIPRYAACAAILPREIAHARRLR
ncbi:WecB/TagA/CpsF family glycosyltransferase [Pontibaca salina]|uniref:WecB/TagA/CpsF family glycosyltransferase n=1 Tax=Pontibaca salina TaxID=2795731 RepID=A0A934HTE4_9RHOB|nr:WecB/TagA/CpsF family glycosyltransferase [Pontibaca salina]MBI6630195.1 WecB/TagA/CpsF family glycosyltransferase [Pontibaca salina]